MTERELLTNVTEALRKAIDHLNWCGYGDNYECDCARSDGLPKKLETALQQADDFLTKKPKR